MLYDLASDLPLTLALSRGAWQSEMNARKVACVD